MMKMKFVGAVSFVMALGSVLAADVQVKQSGDLLEFAAGEQKICSYQMAAGPVPDGTPEIFRHGAHLHPIYSPSGRLVTGNHPADHPWHRGVWMAWTKTQWGDSHPDFWNQGKAGSDKLTAEVRFQELTKSWSGLLAGFQSKHRFIDHASGAEKDVLSETWEVQVSTAAIQERAVHLIDLTSVQACVTEQALQLPEYHYGGLGVRGNAAWDEVDAVTMLTSEGHDRKKGDSTKGKWVYLGGQVEGQQTGMAILIHPSNFRFPQPLRLNPKNPQLCVAPSQGGAWSVEPGKPYTSKYRLVVFDGAADAAWIEHCWKAWSDE
jgi:hypothetical protein